MVAYPMSSSNRVEFGAGLSQLSFDQQTRTVATSLTTGNIIQDSTQTTPLGSTPFATGTAPPNVN